MTHLTSLRREHAKDRDSFLPTPTAASTTTAASCTSTATTASSADATATACGTAGARAAHVASPTHALESLSSSARTILEPSATIA